MRTIWRYDIPVTDMFDISVPVGARILPHVGQRDGLLSVWAEVESDDPRRAVRTIHVVGTGNPLSDVDQRYIGTIEQGPFVWHVYEVTA